jgi:hypothetical protein
MTLKGKGQPQAYGDETYWDSRYSNETRGSFDWYQNYMGMSKLINFYIPKADKVLMVGCGNAGNPLSLSLFYHAHKTNDVFFMTHEFLNIWVISHSLLEIQN